jgi:NAD(P) transhydrogenase subunit beta
VTTRLLFTEAAYLVASVLFILGLRGLTIPDQARRGMRLAALGMLVAIVGTVVKAEIITYQWILAGLALGTLIGWPLGTRVPMTAMPQRIAISHLFGAVAATLVGVAEFWSRGNGARVGRGQMAALGFEVLFGALTITGSFMAFAKLQELLPSRPLTFKGQNLVTLAMLAAAAGLFGWLLVDPANPAAFYAMVGLGLLFGVSLVLPIGGADMPVVISLLNSYAGLASAATGFAIGNNVLIIAGVGAPPPPSEQAAREVVVRSINAEDAAIQLGFARLVIVVPGYGMAVAQAQHQVRELAQLIEGNGGQVLYAVHPVAGRMPGHMNVLLAEADISYDKLKELEEINPQFKDADVALLQA